MYASDVIYTLPAAYMLTMLAVWVVLAFVGSTPNEKLLMKYFPGSVYRRRIIGFAGIILGPVTLVVMLVVWVHNHWRNVLHAIMSDMGM